MKKSTSRHNGSTPRSQTESRAPAASSLKTNTSSGRSRPQNIDFESIAIGAGIYVFRTQDGYGYRCRARSDNEVRFDDEQTAWRVACYDNGLVARPNKTLSR